MKENTLRALLYAIALVLAIIALTACAVETTLCKPDAYSADETVPTVNVDIIPTVAPTESTDIVNPSEPTIPETNTTEPSVPAGPVDPSVPVTQPTEPMEPTVCVHNYETAIVKSASCNFAGAMAYTCVNCGNEYVEEIEKLGHDYIVTTENATCSENGKNIYTCAACGNSYVEEIDKLSHNYADATCTTPQTCTACNATNGGPVGHKYVAVVTEPTCIAHGSTTYTCSICGDTYVGNEVNALGHNYSTETTNHTHLEQGYDTHTCTRCNYTYKDNYVDPIKYTEVNETVYATGGVNVRSGPSTDYQKIGRLEKGESITRIGVGEDGWSKVEYNGEIAYISSKYLSTEKPDTLEYPIVYEDETCKITIYREWYENAWVYAAHIEFTDYTRLSTECANGKYNNGYETTSHAAERLNALLTINGCYSAPSLDYTVVRGGKIWNGASRNLWLPAVYSSHNGLLLSAWETGGDKSVTGKNVQQLVDDGLVTDTFCFGPHGLQNGVITASTSENSRAQRTFIGTNGNAGDIWLCVSDGRYNDGESAGLTQYQCMEYLYSKGCTFGVALDGGGSTTMVWKGQVLNAAKGNERAVVDFLYFK